MAAASAEISAQSLVQGAHPVERGADEEDHHRCDGTKLLVALWKYVTMGVVIEGAVMRSA